MYFNSNRINVRSYLVLCLLILAAGILIGYWLINEPGGPKTGSGDEGIDFFRMLGQNLFFAFALILGAFTFNILSLCCCLYNGVILGLYFRNTMITAGLPKTLSLFLPHGVVEIFWTMYALYISIRLFNAFYSYVISSDRLTRFGAVMYSLKRPLLITVVLIVVSCFIEYFITYKIFAL